MMPKLTQDTLLQRAEYAFLKKEYKVSLRSYGLILKDYPLLDEARIGVYLSDLGLERADEAQALFDYYQIIKNEKEDALAIIDGLITNLDDASYKLERDFISPMQEQLEYSDGISYYDFLLLTKERNFKEVFENIMFSTKIMITNKNDFIDFIKQLAFNGFKDMALRYLDASSNLFGNDQSILELYNVIEGK